jgi:hypothetical protein
MTPIDQFERLLPAALADLGESSTPDYLTDILGRTARTRQRSAWASLERWLPMPAPLSPRLVVVVVLTALIIGLVGFVSLSGGGDAGPGPAITPPASAATGAIPEALRSTWMGAEATLPGFVPSSGSALEFSDDRFTFSQSADSPKSWLTSAASAVGDGRFELALTDPDDGVGCQAGDIGLYAWEQSSSGRILTITAVDDACASRLDAVPGVWWRRGCKNREDNCLGDLDAGTYKSQFIVPRVDPTDPWEPEFGALTYTVPDGWANADDWPSTFSLTPSRDYALATPQNLEVKDSIYLFTHSVPMAQDTPCSGRPDPDAGRTVAEQIAFVRQVPGLVTSEPTEMTIDGHPAQWLDLALSPDWTSGCPGFAPVVEFLLNARDRIGIGVPGAHRQRLILVDLGDGDILGIQIDSADPADFDGFVAEAMPVVESFTFE